MAIRFCSVLFPQLIEVKEDGSFSGFLKPIWNTYVECLSRKFENVSVTAHGPLGEAAGNSMQLTGCMGRLQRNESDVACPFMEYPIAAPGVRMSTFMLATKTSIVSAYNDLPNESATDVMDAFHSFTPSLWLLVATTALLLTMFVSVSTLSNNKRQRRLSFRSRSISLSIRITMGYMLKQHSRYNYNRYHYQRLLIAVLTIFSFLVTFYFTSMIKTEMVVQKDPVTVTTYDEILERNVQPAFVEAVNDHADFKYATPGSTADKI
jgi:hypothetical protein